MLSILKKMFLRKVECSVETYGKLPCYKDYISVITTPGAAQWRDWLLESFKGKDMPPEGVWPFIYQHHKKSDLVVGVVQPSSDGLRQFPFSLFVVCRHGSRGGGLCPRPLAMSIWQELLELYPHLIGAEDIQDFYVRLYGKKISLLLEKSKENEEDKKFSYDCVGEWPQMLVAKTRDSRKLHLISGGKTIKTQFIQNWNGLVLNETFVAPPLFTQDDLLANIDIDLHNPSGDESEAGHREQFQED